MRFNNPSRRNRNIGTSASGHGSDSKLVIPDIRATERVWFENVSAVETCARIVLGRERLFFLESLSPGYAHACSVDDVCSVLESIPADDLLGLNAFLFRQPTRKQALLKPSWGRLTYFGEVGLLAGKKLYEGPLIALEAQLIELKFQWSKSLDPEHQRELDRLRGDGHVITDDGKRWRVESTPASLRSTQLNRTLPHEIGHWVDYLEKVERPFSEGDDRELLSERYFQRSAEEREAFAHRYAREFAEHQSKAYPRC